MESLLTAAVGAHNKLHLALGDSVPPILGDGVRIRQLVLALVHEASRAIGKRGGTILVTTHVAEDKAVLDVTYDGPATDRVSGIHDDVQVSTADDEGTLISVAFPISSAARSTA
jgi:nitrogen-specific signal transduction histidine kinase